jgi:hypothetical protein
MRAALSELLRLLKSSIEKSKLHSPLSRTIGRSCLLLLRLPRSGFRISCVTKAAISRLLLVAIALRLGACSHLWLHCSESIYGA